MRGILRILAWVMSFSICASFTSVYAGGIETDNVFEEVIVEGESYYVSKVEHIAANVTRMVCYDDQYITTMYVDYGNMQVRIEEVLQSDTSQISIKIMDLCGDVVSNMDASAKVIHNQSETWWGFEYYNTSSAYEDTYWRLYNPLDEEQTSNYFFTAFGSYEQTQAENFAMCVNDMVAIEDGIDISAGFSIAK